MDTITREDFKQLYFIDKEIKKLKLEIEDIEVRKGMHCTQSYENMDMPRGSGTSNPVCDASVEAVTVEEVLIYALNKRKKEKAKLYKIIAEEPDAETRLILEHRYIDGMEWDDVAEAVGSTYHGVKQKDKRFFQKMKK